MKIELYIEDPTPEDWQRLGEMIQEGYSSGINLPVGMTWKIIEEEENSSKD